ncbi:MAG: cyclic nucleotide-binding domain-containing protein [Melioribacteraceae bacterium]|jgi:CRP-like cAMP-binding protein|nr:cyclic nucleotide-binding domain-containing protein [Melioribacteraceae bacterium]
MSKLKSYLAGSTIAKEGEPARKLFILVEGKIGIYKGNSKITEFDKEGEIVGEMSLILKKPRSAEIRAITDAKLLEVEGELDDIVKQYPEISKKIIHSLAERLTQATDRI